jgi:hypothetical protein
VAAVNNIVDALEAQVSSPQTIVAELVSACPALPPRCSACEVSCVLTRAPG